ncbi:MAG: metallophosphoesterase [Myxococcota bacterium]
MTPNPTVTLAIIGDIHAEFARLDAVLARIRAVPEVDGILLVGDIGDEPPYALGRSTEQGQAFRAASVARVVEHIEALGLPVLWVPGNHDPEHLPLRGNVDRGEGVIAGLRVTGIGGAGPARFGFPYEWGEDDVRARQLPEWDVIISHAPPLDTALDRTRRGASAGSLAVRELAERGRGLMVSGHIHESPGAERVADTVCVNAGGLGQPYGRTQVVFATRTASPRETWDIAHEDLQSGETRRWRFEL